MKGLFLGNTFSGVSGMTACENRESVVSGLLTLGGEWKRSMGLDCIESGVAGITVEIKVMK